MLALIMIWVGAVAAVLLLALGVLLAVVGVRRFRRRRAEAVQAPDAAEPKASVAPAPGFPEYDPANPHYRDGHQWIDGQWRQVQVWDEASQQWYLHGVDANGAPTARAVGVPRKPRRTPSPRGAIAMATVGALLAVGAVPLGVGAGSALLSSVAAVGGLPTAIVQESAQYRFTEPTVIDHDEVLHYQFRVSDDEFSEQAYEDNQRNNGMVAAFFDSQLTLLADYEAHVNFVDNSLALTPERRTTDSIDDDSIFAGAGASWAPMSELYLVQYIDRDGNAYDKPIVTRAQIRKAAKAPDAPTVAVATAPDGYLDMTWEAVPGAANYAVFATAQTERGTNTYTVIGMTESGETSWSSRGAAPEDCYFSHGGEVVQNCALQPSWVSRTNGSQTGYGVVAMSADGTPSFMQRIDGSGIDSSLPGEVSIERPVGTTSWYSGQPDSFPLRAQAGTVSGDLVEVPLVFDHAEVTAGGQTGWIYARATGTAATVRLGWDGIDGTWDGFVAEVKNRLDSAASDLTGIAEPSFLEVAEPLSEDIPVSATAPQTDLPVPDEFGPIGEYIAANLIAGNQRIDMDAVANPFSSRELVDAVISQTPYAYVAQYTFRPDETGREILEVSYEMGVDEMRDLQNRTRDRVREVVGQVVTEGMSDRDKALALNDWIIENAQYDDAAFDAMTADRSTARDPQYAHAWRPDGILLQGTAVCGGYAEAFQVLSEEAGLDTVYVTGTVDTNRHAWNKTFWDGQWWVIDTTWNDTTPQNELFAISDEVALNDWKHTIENMYWTVPTMVAQYATP